MRSGTGIALQAARWLLTGLALVALLLLALTRTDPGRSTLAELLPLLLGQTVSVRGLRGDLPDNLQADAVEIRDAKGVWLRIENVSLQWSALAALNDHIDIRDVTAAKVSVLRMPVSEETSEGTTPVIDVDRLSVARIEIAKAVAGREALLTAQGTLHYQSVHQANADLTIARLDAPDRYRVHGRIVQDVANGAVSIREGTNGILAGLIGLPGLGRINLEAEAGGNAAQNDVAFQMTAGALHATGHGTVALAKRSAAIDFSAQSPAMQPRADVSWQSLALEGHMRGAFDAPALDATFRIDGVKAAGAAADRIAAKLAGGNGAAELTATATRLRIPGDPDLLSGAPLVVQAHANLKSAARPIAFAVIHPRIGVRGSLRTGGLAVLSAVVTIPSLAPFSALAGTGLGGAARFNVHAQRNKGVTVVALDGNLRMAGDALAARLLGNNATLTAKANFAGADIPYSIFSLRGAALSADAKGTLRDDTLNYGAQIAISNLARLAATLNGDAKLEASLSGPSTAVNLKASGSANIATRGFAPQSVGFSLSASGLPDPSSAQVRIGGHLDNSPVSVDGMLTKDGTMRTAKLDAKWKSLNADADFKLPRNGNMTGRANIMLGNLADLAAFIGTKLEGSVKAAVSADMRGGTSLAKIAATGSGIRTGDTRLDALSLNGTVADPLNTPSFDIAFRASRLAAAGMAGDASGHIKGPLDKLAATLQAQLRDKSGNPVHADATAVIDTAKQKIALQTFAGRWQDQTATLTAPATIAYAGGIAVDKLAANLSGGSLTLSGRLTPKLDAAIAIRDVPTDALQKFVPQLAAKGTISGTAHLTGTLEAPRGTLTVQARNLRASGVSQQAVAPADLDARATLQGDSMTLTATLAAGKSANLAITGEAPLNTARPMALHLTGSADLSILNTVTTASGRRVRGTLTMDMRLAGTYAAPRATGGGNLADGDLQDFTQGIRIRAIKAAFQARGNAIHITALSARAGLGTITGSGTIDLASPGMPVDISIAAKNARPIVSDKLTATLSGDLKLSGKLKEDVKLSGRIRVLEGEINLPDKFPPEVAVLDVRRPGQAPPPPPQPSSAIDLDVTLNAPEQIFVRGHGIDAEVSGRVQITGTAAAPLISGGFDMRRGTLSIAGQTLNFTSGKVGFNGTGVRHKLDPTLDFAASTTSGGVTATLTVGGYASAPTIALSSTPQLPQDEVLAHLLFQQSVKELSPLQLAEIAQALASLGGIGNGFSPMSAIRKGLGLDRLSVGGGNGGSGQTSVEAGKYVARNVYVGARQNLSGGTQVQVQVDITRRLKAQATLSTVTNATVTKGNAAQDNGSSVGLSYQFEY
ncbi:MAG: translocation/assembly module TamB domain-containing protein [Proteobacteria bacterium]|nr:translocation/assembly module TamB domain-containing protein [Pseudomonadota bacterium]